MKTKKQIKMEISKLEKSFNDINNEMEILRNELAAVNSKEIFTLLPGSVWKLDNDGLYYVSKEKPNSPDPLVEFVCRELNLWPHGRAFVSKNIEVICDDGTVLLRANLNMKDYESRKSNSENITRKTILAFVKENKMVIDLSAIEAHVEHKKRQLKQDEDELAALREELK